MAGKITKSDVLDTLKEGRKFIGELVVKTFNQTREQIFTEAIEIGI